MTATIHHTDCGMELFTNEIMCNLLASSLETATFDGEWKDTGSIPGSDAGKDIDFLTISNLAGSVVEDVEKIRNHPLVPHNIPIYGYIYDVKTGKLIEVSDATVAGAVK